MFSCIFDLYFHIESHHFELYHQFGDTLYIAVYIHSTVPKIGWQTLFFLSLQWEYTHKVSPLILETPCVYIIFLIYLYYLYIFRSQRKLRGFRWSVNYERRMQQHSSPIITSAYYGLLLQQTHYLHLHERMARDTLSAGPQSRGSRDALRLRYPAN